jgi:lysophospholipase L1-like esterase
MKAIDPQLVIFSIGTNDAYTKNFDRAKFKDQYSKLLDSTRAALPQAAILITVPNDSYLYRRYVNQNTAEMEKVIYELAGKYNCGVYDFYSVMGGLNSSQTWYNMRLMQYDRVHFTREGYLLKGDLFFAAFLKGWETHLAAKEPKVEHIEEIDLMTLENPDDENSLHELLQ